MRSILLMVAAILFVALFILVFIGYGFYLMDIEDQYGDYQEVFYDASTGDIILNRDTAEFGIVDKSWTRLYVNTKEKDSMDLYTFATKQNYYSKLEIYKTNLDVENIKHYDISEVHKLIDDKKIKLRFIHQNK